MLLKVFLIHMRSGLDIMSRMAIFKCFFCWHTIVLEATRELVGSVTLDLETLEIVPAADDPKKNADYFM